MKVAVTGATGVVGAALVRHLLAEGHQVRALVRSLGSELETLGVDTEIGDIRSIDSLLRLASGCEVFFNVAGINRLCVRDPTQMEQVNIHGVRNAMEACRKTGVRRLVHTSSAVTLGEARGTVATEHAEHRGWFLSEYERTKYLGEQALFAEAGDLETIAVNPSSVQGPGRATGTAQIILDVVKGKLPFVTDTVVSLVDIDDCSRGHLLAALVGKPGERYVLNGSTITVRAALEMAREFLGRTVEPRFLPGWLLSAGVGVAEPAARLFRKNLPVCREMVRVLRFGHRYDGSRATTDLGLEYRSINETIDRTMRWFEAEGLLGQDWNPA